MAEKMKRPETKPSILTEMVARGEGFIGSKCYIETNLVCTNNTLYFIPGIIKGLKPGKCGCLHVVVELSPPVPLPDCSREVTFDFDQVFMLKEECIRIVDIRIRLAKYNKDCERHSSTIRDLKRRYTHFFDEASPEIQAEVTDLVDGGSVSSLRMDELKAGIELMARRKWFPEYPGKDDLEDLT